MAKLTCQAQSVGGSLASGISQVTIAKGDDAPDRRLATEIEALRVCVIGAGMAGMACGQALRDVGHTVTLIDKGRGAGGRMATRRLATPLGEVSFDHGAQYFTARDADFRNQVQRWASDGHVSRWTAVSEDAWVGAPGMNAPLNAMATDLDVMWSVRVTRISRTSTGWTVSADSSPVLTVDAVVVAIPAEQAADLLTPIVPEMAAMARGVPSSPCWTLMLAFGDRLPGDLDWLRGDDDSALGWAARNSAKPGRGPIEAWVVQAGGEWSARNLDMPKDEVEAGLTDALSYRLGAALPAPIACSSHRWLYARAGRGGLDALWDADLKLGVCGDWLTGPRVEAAWTSGTRLAARMTGDAEVERHRR